MRALWLFALLIALPATSRGEPMSCAVRLRPEWAPAVIEATPGAPWLAALPQSPLQVQPLLAATRPPAKAGSAAPPSSQGPGSAHPMAAWQVLRFADAASLAAALSVLASRPEVLAVEPLRSMTLCAESDAAPVAAGGTIPWNVARLGAPEALVAIEPDTTLIVAVIDTGADLEHPDLAPRLWRNDDPPGNGSTADDLNDQNGDGFIEDWERDDDDDNGYVDDTFGFDFTDAPGADGTGDTEGRDPDPQDDNGHGTHVAGIIAAQGGLQGVAPFVRLMPVRAAYNQIFGSGALETDDAAAAIVYAVDNGARVLNLSWGDREESLLIRAALDYAVERGVVVVAAAGNGGASGPHFPSGDARVVGVAASNRQGARAAFSNRGAAAGVEVAAPGEEGSFPLGGIMSLVPLELDDDGRQDGYTERRGTSMSAAHVSGVMALILSRPEHPDARRARALLVASARRGAEGDWSEALGHGEVDALAGVSTKDDLVVIVSGPPAPYRQGTLTLVGTVLSGASTWRSLVLHHQASGARHTVFADLEGSIVADTLVHTDFSTQDEGEWEYVLSAHTAEGRRRERHGSFRVDVSPATIDTAVVVAGWRRGEPRWLLNVEANEAVRARVFDPGSVAPLMSAAGLAKSIQIESPATGSSGPSWTLQLENEVGLFTQSTLAPPVDLPPWPETNLLVRLDEGSFTATSVWGMSPAGPVVWGLGPFFFDVQAFGVEDDRFVLRNPGGTLFGRPRGYADVNGDTSADLLVQMGPESVGWILTLSDSTLPESSWTWTVRGRALGLFQLDDDSLFETLLARRDTLVLYDDLRFRTPLQVLVNPNRSGFNEWGPGAAAGDFDGDGLFEIACGDAEGFVSRFERLPGGAFQLDEMIDTGGTYAYELLALPEGGLLAGRQRSRDVTGDGFPVALYEFTVYAPSPQDAYAFLAGENELRAGAAVARSPATGTSWLALVQDRDLYMARGLPAPREPVLRLGDAAGEPPVVADLDGDGFLEVVLPTEEGSGLYRLLEQRRGPSALQAESLGPRRLRLTWEAGDAISFRVWRRSDSWWEDVGTTQATTWVDTTVQEFVNYSYELDGLLPDSSVVRSKAIVARAQPLPRWLEARVLGPAALGLRASNPLDRGALEPRHFRVRGQDGSERSVDAVSLAEENRVVHLVLDAPLLCGSFTVETQRLRDDQGGAFADAAAAIEGFRDCDISPLLVVAVRLLAPAHAFEIEWSREPDAAADDVSSYALGWDAQPLPILRVERPDPVHSRLVLADSTPLVGRGIPYVLRILAPIVAATDGAPLEGAELEHRVYVEGQGALQVRALPNPARGTDVVFVDTADDTRVQIYDLQGQLVRELQGALGGGLTWDLRNGAGQPVASGVYVFVARDARGTSTGRVAILQ